MTIWKARWENPEFQVSGVCSLCQHSIHSRSDVSSSNAHTLYSALMETEMQEQTGDKTRNSEQSKGRRGRVERNGKLSRS